MALRRWVEVPQSAGSREIFEPAQKPSYVKSLIDEQKYLGSTGRMKRFPPRIESGFQQDHLGERLLIIRTIISPETNVIHTFNACGEERSEA